MLRSTRIRLASLALGLTIGCGIVAVSIERKPVTAGGNIKISKEVGALRARLSGKLKSALTRVEQGNYEDAREIAQRLHDAGDVQASYLLGFLKENGLGGPQDKSNAMDLYLIAANDGVSDAQFALGNQAAARGRYPVAYEWLTKAAKQDHPQAQTRLATLYAEGKGGVADPKKAFELFSAAAAHGDMEGLAGVGIAHLTGAGASLDYPKAAKAFEAAAQLGHAQSQYNLALLYDSKLIGKPDVGKTHRWMTAAAENGMAAANVALGLMAHEGGGSDKTGATPADYFVKAAEAGDAQGMFLFAVALSEGDGVEKDETTAVFWLDSVLAAGDASRELKSAANSLRIKLAGEASPVLGPLSLRE